MSQSSYDIEQFINAVASSVSIAEVLRRLRLQPSGANYKMIHRKVRQLDLDTSHWTGQAHLRGRTHNWSRCIPLEEILILHSPCTSTSRLKQRLIRANLLAPCCSICGIHMWNGKPLALHLDHINGVNDDYRIENLRLLCPNCHSQTENYAGRNIKRKRITLHLNSKKCLTCGKPISQCATHCKSCAISRRVPKKIDWPSIADLIVMVSRSSYRAVSRQLGVSDNAIRKHIKRHAIHERPTSR
jgi:5-methylcytosine-specific restriction endonuclease McrA